MTRRMLLTLIAILTGLSWQASGMQARAEAAASPVCAVGALSTVRQAKVGALAARRTAESADSIDGSDCLSLAGVMPGRSPRVRVGIDRARE